MLSKTSQYALRALIYLTQHEDAWPIPGTRIAKEVGVPSKYLSKVLGDLVRSNVLDASPGRTGGFRLRRAPEWTYLIDVLTPFEHFDRRECPFGNHTCSDEHPCAAHHDWKEVVTAQQSFLRNTNLRDIASDAQKPRKPKTKRAKRR
jgi:Rrf2 family protein